MLTPQWVSMCSVQVRVVTSAHRDPLLSMGSSLLQLQILIQP